MDTGASNVIAQGMLKGCFDAFSDQLARTFDCDVEEMSDLAPDALGELVARHPVVVRCRIKEQGALALLLDEAGAAGLLAAKDASEPAELDEGRLDELRDLAAAGLSAGLEHLNEKLETQFTSDSVEVVIAREGDGDLASFLGGASTVAHLRLSTDGEGDGGAALLFTQDLEALVPRKLVDLLFGGDGAAAANGDGTDGPQLDESEMSDILSTFDSETPPDQQEAPVDSARAKEPDQRIMSNIDRVLDIGLTATARLGRVYMPISEILALGPGSIIEVGHLVDEPVELLVNDKLIARGDVVVVDEKFGLRITEIVSPRERIESLR